MFLIFKYIYIFVLCPFGAFFFLLFFGLTWLNLEDRDGPWLGMHNTRTGSASAKTDKPNAKDLSAAASPIPESRCAPVDNPWPDNCDPPPKSKGKSVKLKKNSKAENSKKLIRQGSKDSVVLVGYKNLKAPYGASSSKYKEGEVALNQAEEQGTLLGDTTSHLRTNASSVFDSVVTSVHSGNRADDAVVDNNVTNAACQKGIFTNPTILDTQSNPQAGTGAVATCNQPIPKDKQDHSGQKMPQWSAGLKQNEVEGSNKDPYQHDKVMALPCQAEGRVNSNIPEITQTDLCYSQQSFVESVFERPSKETAQRSQSCVVSVQVKSDCIRLTDGGAPSASSRLSDSGIESEPSSFATQLVLGQNTRAGVCVGESGVAVAPQPERALQSSAPRPVQHSTVQKPGGAGEILYPESISAVSGVQSSLTSINSLPSDDEGEGSSRASSGAEVRGRKSSIFVQEQSLVFSGDISGRPDAACKPDTVTGDSQLGKPSLDLETDPKLICISDLGLQEAASSGYKESRSEPHTACPSSNSATTSSTDLVKRGMVENYFGSCSSTDVSEISPIETSAITLGIQAGPQVEEDEDETEHEMIENGYYEEGDGYAFVNGVADDEQVGDAAAQETNLSFEQLGIGYLHETKDLSKAPICSNITASSVGYSFGRPPYSATSLPSSLQWYECAPTPQMKA